MRVPYTPVFRQYRMKKDNVNALSVTVTHTHTHTHTHTTSENIHKPQ